MIDGFIEYLRYERNFSVHTAFAYREDLVQLSEWLSAQGGSFDDLSMTSDDVRGWIMWMVGEMEMKASSVHRKVSALNSFYRWLILKGLVDEKTVNPTIGVPLPKKSKNLPVYFLEKEMDKCLEMLENSRNFDDVRNLMVIETIYQTGLRRSEVAGLKDVDVDIRGGKLTVLGKGNKQRIVPFGNDLAEKMTNYRTMRDEMFAERCDNFFVDDHGRALSASHIYNIVHRVMGKVSTQAKISPHVIRHSFATAMLNRGADLNVIKELLGHESLATTQIYTHVSFEQLKGEYKKSHPRG
ncbi:MAG: tyrosine-type recombinase/integrase [Paludibacteraceae bacterium]|nr:tyrosine-type recombinase/integrase [Paludibacteraceae bacterium]